MAVSVKYAAPHTEQVSGSLRATIFDLTLEVNDYVTGGISISPYVPGTVVGVDFLGQKGTNVGYAPVYDITNKKVQLFQTAGTAGQLSEVPNGSSAAITLRVKAYWV